MNTKIKIIALAILAVVLFILTGLPSVSDLGAKPALAAKYKAIPEFDPVPLAKAALAERDYATCLILCELNHAKGAESVMKQCLDELAKLPAERNELETSGHQIDKRAVWNKLKAASVADYFNSIKGTDLAKKLDEKSYKSSFSENANKLAPLYGLFPECYDLLDLLTVADHANALNNAYKLQLVRQLVNVKFDQENTAAVRELAQDLILIWELAKQTGKWSEFAVIMPNIEHRNQLTMLLQLRSKSETAFVKLERILAVVSAKPKLKIAVLSYINEHGVAGLDNAYAAISRGPEGLLFLTENPSFHLAAFQENYQQASGLKGWWLRNVTTGMGLTADIIRYILMSVIASVIVISLLPASYVTTGGRTKAKVSAQVIAVTVCVFALLFIVSHVLPGGEDTIPAGAGAAVSGGTGQGAALVSQTGQRFTAMSFFALIIIVLVQAGVYLKALAELKKIQDLKASAKEKFRQVENIDIFFDLPLYLGLLGTVSSFIMMLFSPTVSQIVAYSSTIIGIILSALIRIFHLYPFRRELITQTSSDVGEEQEA